VSASAVTPIVVRRELRLLKMQAYLLSGTRKLPVVAFTQSLERDEPVLGARDVRAVVGPGPRIYYIPEEHCLLKVRRALGQALTLPVGAARVWWPGLSVGSDPSEHPLVVELDGEPDQHMLGEFARRFDLSRPRVLEEIRQIEDVRRLAEDELAKARQQNRDLQIERREAHTRAETAEANLKAARQRLAEMGGPGEPGSL